MEINRRAFVASLGGTAAVALMSPEEKADALEHYMGTRLEEAGTVEGLLAEAQDEGYPTVADLERRNANLDRAHRGGPPRAPRPVTRSVFPIPTGRLD